MWYQSGYLCELANRQKITRMPAERIVPMVCSIDDACLLTPSKRLRLFFRAYRLRLGGDNLIFPSFR